MAFDITEPSMGDADWPTFAAKARENYRAIVQGDANVLSRFEVDGSGSILGGTAFYNSAFRQDTTNNRGVLLGYDSSGQIGVIAASGTTGSLAWWTNVASVWAERMRLTSAGNFGIGNAAPGALLDVGPGGTGSNNADMYLNSGSGTAGALLQFARNSVRKGYIAIGSAGFAVAGDAANDLDIVSVQAINLSSDSGATIQFSVTPTGTLAGKRAALATNATAGFLYIPTCAGAPTGVASAVTGMGPMVWDTTNNKLWIYNGAWKGVVLA